MRLTYALSLGDYKTVFSYYSLVVFLFFLKIDHELFAITQIYNAIDFKNSNKLP